MKDPGETTAALLHRRVADPGWTPGARDLAPLLALYCAAAEADAPAILRALIRRAVDVGPLAVAALDATPAAAQVRVLRLLGRLVTGGVAPDGAVDAALARLGGEVPAVRRQAARMLGGLRPAPPAVVAALAEALAREAAADVRRALIEALGKLGGVAASAALAVAADDAPATGARLERARLTAARAIHREARSEIDLDVAPPAPLVIALHCRRGLASLLADDLAQLGAEIVDPAQVRLRWSSGLRALYRSRLFFRLGVPLPAPAASSVRPPTDPAAAIAAQITAPATRALFAALTDGPVRYRLAWDDGAHHRSATFAIAAAIAAAAPELINDPSDATWQIRIGARAAAGRAPTVELEPRRIDDDRFAYRTGDVPAASHPTLAAALARLAVAHAREPARDVVWDPFVGSGQELIERALAGPVAALHGTDIEPAALVTAADNLAAAGRTATLTRADARRHRIAGLTAIISNPPMGRRVARGQARELVDDFLVHAAGQLGPGGVLVWISPFPAATRERAAELGFALREAYLVDLGGFDGEIQVLVRGAATERHQRGEEVARPDLTGSRRRTPRRR